MCFKLFPQKNIIFIKKVFFLSIILKNKKKISATKKNVDKIWKYETVRISLF